MRKLFILDESEKKRILNMHTSATSRQYLNEQIDYRITCDDYDKVSDLLATNRGMRGIRKVENVLTSIPKECFDEFIQKLISEKLGQYTGLSSLINNKVASNESNILNRINVQFNEKSSKYKINWQSEGNSVKTNSVIITPKDAPGSDYNLKKGDRGKQVAVLQRALSSVNPNVSLKDDGIFGPKTEQAVKDFQSRNNLEVTGIANNVTMAKLMSMVPNPQAVLRGDGTQQQRTGQQRTSRGSNTLQRGSKGPEVVDVKKRINQKYNYIIKDLGIDVNDDTYDDDTVSAVAYFQAKEGLGVDGKVGPETRKALEQIQISDNSADSAVDMVDDGGQQDMA